MTGAAAIGAVHADGFFRIRFRVANLRIKEAVTCGPFTLTPVGKRVGDKVPHDPWSIRCEATCTGLSESEPVVGGLDAVWNQATHDLRDLYLLLTWVNHGPAPIFDVSIEAAHAGTWKRVQSWPTMFGRLVRPLSGLGDVQIRAEILLDVAWAAFQRTDLAYDRHLKACLVYYAEAVGTDMADAKFVLGWMALEVLLSGTDVSTSILGSNRFKRVRNSLATTLRTSAEYPSESHMRAAVDKLPELNRWPLKIVAQECFKQLFRLTSQDEREAAVQDVLSLSSTRNKIVHTGGIRPWTGPAGPDEVETYLETMNREWLRLHSLLTRCIHALIVQAATEELVEAVLARVKP